MGAPRAQWRNGSTFSFTPRDAAGRLSTLSNDLLSWLGFTLNQWLGFTLNQWLGFTLDQWLGFELSGIGAVYSTTYTYDPVGNRLVETDAVQGLVTRTYDPSNLLLTEATSAGVTTYAYDESGNRVRKETPSTLTVYAYDALERLAQAVKDLSGLLLRRYWIVRERLQAASADFPAQRVIGPTVYGGQTKRRKVFNCFFICSAPFHGASRWNGLSQIDGGARGSSPTAARKPMNGS